MALIDEVKEQHAKVKGKGFKYKFSYFWEYYRIHTLVAVIILILGFSFIKSMVTAKKTVFQAIFVNAIHVPNEQEFAVALQINEKKEAVLIDGSYTISLDTYDQYSYANQQKLMAVMASRDAEVIVSDSAYIESYMDSDVFGDLRDFFSDEELAAMGDKVIWHKPVNAETGEEGENMPLAIDITDAPQIKDNVCFAPESKVYMGVICNTKRAATIPVFYNFLYSSSSSATE